MITALMVLVCAAAVVGWVLAGIALVASILAAITLVASCLLAVVPRLRDSNSASLYDQKFLDDVGIRL